MKDIGNTKLHRHRKFFITIVILTVLLVIVAIKVYSASLNFGINEASNEDTLTRLVAALAKSQYADRLVTKDNVSTKLFYFVNNSNASVSEDTSADAIIVTYTESGRKYYINKNTTYTIKFDANGGQNPPASQKQGYGKKVTLTTDKPTRSGYVFLGWDTSYNAEEPRYLSGATYKGNGNVTLYAIWKEKTYTITYDANKGTGAPASQEKIHGKNLTLSLRIPIRTGHTFKGWGTSKTATTKSYDAGGTFTTDADTTLYAVWNVNTYKITYNANGGSGAPAQQTYTYDETGTVALSTTKPTYSGHEFLGWSESTGETTKLYDAGANWNRSVASDTTLYAVWKLDKYTVSYNANGGSGTVTAQTANNGSSITLRSNTFTAPSEYHFSKWNTNSGGTGTAYSQGATFSSTSNVTLYAIWEKHTSSCYERNGCDGGDAMWYCSYCKAEQGIGNRFGTNHTSDCIYKGQSNQNGCYYHTSESECTDWSHGELTCGGTQ